MRKLSVDTDETTLFLAISIFFFAVSLLAFYFLKAFVVPAITVINAIIVPCLYYIGSRNIREGVSGNALFILAYILVSLSVVFILSILMYAFAPAITLMLSKTPANGSVPILLTGHEHSMLAGHQLLFKTILTLPGVLVLILTVDYLVNMLKLARSTDIVFEITMQAISATLLLNMSAISYILYNVLLTAQPAHNSTYQYYISSVTLQQLKMMKHLGLIPHLLVTISETYLIVTFVLIIISILKTVMSERAE